MYKVVLNNHSQYGYSGLKTSNSYHAVEFCIGKGESGKKISLRDESCLRFMISQCQKLGIGVEVLPEEGTMDPIKEESIGVSDDTPVDPPKKKRGGRPKGSKNKPKNLI